MANLVDANLAALCGAIAGLPTGAAPPPEIAEALTQLSQSDDPAQAALGAYLRARIAAEDAPPPAIGEPIDTLLAAVFPVHRAT